MLQDSGHKQSFERRLIQIHLLALESLLKKKEETVLPGVEMLEAAMWGSLFYCDDTSTGRRHSGPPPPTPPRVLELGLACLSVDCHQVWATLGHTDIPVGFWLYSPVG